MESLYSDLKKEPIANIPNHMSKGKIITIKRSDSIDMALKVLSENDISSCPVMDPLGCMGIIDMFDIVSYLLSLFTKSEVTSGKSNKFVGMSYFNLNIDPVSVVLGSSSTSSPKPDLSLCPVRETDSVFSLIEMFAMNLPRVVVFTDGTGYMGSGPQVHRLISQTDVVKYLWNHPTIKEKLLKSKHITVENLYRSSPKFVNESTPTIEVLRLLTEYKISAVAVVSEKGKFKNEISTDSWKGLNHENMELLFEDTKTFLKSKKKAKPVFTCQIDTPIQEIWEEFSSKRIHRAWVLNDKKCLIGVLSISDLLKSLILVKGTDNKPLPIHS
eukprot:gene5925-7377_t